MKEYYEIMVHNKGVQLLIIFITLDVIFGVLRAIREGKLNSSIGIDGIIRKVGMIVTICVSILVDMIVSVDLIGFDVIINDKTIGVIKDVLDTPANEVLVLDNNIMIPYVDAFIKEIDIKNKKVSVYEVKGLLS